MLVGMLWEGRNPHELLVGMKIITATMERSTDVLQKTKNRTTV
jgi:hypothetical protein